MHLCFLGMMCSFMVMGTAWKLFFEAWVIHGVVIRLAWKGHAYSMEGSWKGHGYSMEIAWKGHVYSMEMAWERNSEAWS